MNLEEFTKVVIHLVLKHNQKIIEKYPLEKGMITSGLTATPINLWNWGIANKKGRLQTVNDKNVLRMNLLPKGRARITRAGLKFKGLYYGSEKAINEQWYLKLKNTSIEVLYDPREMNQIYIPHSDGRDFDTCYLLDTSFEYKGDTLEEIEFYQNLLQEAKAEEQVRQRENTINADLAIEEIVKQAMKNKKQSEPQRINKSEKLRNIRENRQVEKVLNRESEKFDLSPDKVSESAEVIDFATKEKVDEAPPKKSPSRLIQKLKKKRDEEFGKNK